MWNHVDLFLCALWAGNYLPILTQLAEGRNSNNDTRIISETTLTYHLAVLIDNFNSLNAKFTLLSVQICELTRISRLSPAWKLKLHFTRITDVSPALAMFHPHSVIVK